MFRDGCRCGFAKKKKHAVCEGSRSAVQKKNLLKVFFGGETKDHNPPLLPLPSLPPFPDRASSALPFLSPGSLMKILEIFLEYS